MYVRTRWLADIGEECGRYANFRYRPNRCVVRLEPVENAVTGIRYVDLATGRVETAPCEFVVLAAGAIGTGAIFLRTLRADPRDRLTAPPANHAPPNPAWPLLFRLRLIARPESGQVVE